MSYDTEILIKISNDKDIPNIEIINQKIKELPYVGAIYFKPVPNSHWYYGEFNHLYRDDLLKIMKGLKWKWLFAVLIIIKDEHGAVMIRRLEDGETRYNEKIS